MHCKLKARLQIKIQEFLDENTDEIGEIEGIWQDDSMSEQTALIMANAAEVCIDAMAHQIELERRFNS